MNPTIPPDDDDRRPDSPAHWLDVACDRFEADWRGGHHPRIEDFLNLTAEPERPALLGALIRLEIELRKGRGEHPSSDEYCDRFPPQSDSITAAFAENAPASRRTRDAQFADPDVRTRLPIVSTTRNDCDDSPHSTVLYPSLGSSTSASSRFHILRPHAKGGLDEVFVARDSELKRDVALKQIQDQFADDVRYRLRFEFEAEVTGGLEHPGIVPVYGLGHTADGRPFYAMRFIRGTSLKEAIRRFHEAEKQPKRDSGKRTMELRELLGRFIDVCDAVAYAHSRAVLHRDLKPANVMLGKYGETLVVDWGLAKALDQPESESQIDRSELPLKPVSGSALEPTLAGSAVGTPAYMSPEQVDGRLAELGVRSDVYCLGATLYHLLTGHAPCETEKVGETYQKILAGDIPRPRSRNSRIAPGLEAICLKALALKPADRYESANAIKTDIERWLADEPLAAYSDPPWIRVSRWSRRHRVAVVAFVVLLTVLVPALVTANILVQKEKRRAEQNFRQARAAVRDFFVLASAAPGDGTTDPRRRICTIAKSYYEEFLRDRSGDPSLTAELAGSHFKLSTIILVDLRDQLYRFKMQPRPQSKAHASSENRVAFPPDTPSWAADLDEAIRHNEVALRLYRRLIESHHAPKEREYQLCDEQRRVLEELRRHPDATEGPGFGGGTGPALQIFASIGD